MSGAQAHACSAWRKWRRLSWRDRLLFGEAALLLTLSSLAIALFRFRFVTRTAGWGGRDDPPLSERRIAVRRVRRAVLAVARRLPWRPMCFQQGLAAQWMLRRRGIPSVLYYGAAADSGKGLAAHVWVKDGEFPVLGGRVAARFAVLATFPPPAP